MHSQVATHIADNHDIDMPKTMYDAVREPRTGNERYLLTSIDW
jgi:hypothetical protein